MTRNMNSKPLLGAVAVLAVIMAAVIVAVPAASEDSDADVQNATAYVGQYYSETFTFTITDEDDSFISFTSASAGEVFCNSTGYSSGSSSYLGLSGTLTAVSYTSGAVTATLTVSGTPTGTGTAYIMGTVNYVMKTQDYSALDGQAYATAKITIEEPQSTKVTSISISGSTSVSIGSYITLTATTTPSNADDVTVTWSVSSTSYATLSKQTDTSTGGTCRLTGVKSGTVTVTATADDGSGVKATYSVTINSTTATLKYDANGGSGAPTTQTYTSTTTASHTFTISSTTPTRSGYTFLGWSTSSTATTATYSAGGTISVGYSSTVTLYAVWEAASTPVTSVSVTSSYTYVGVGSSITLTATTSPTSATDRTVTWSITSGSSYATLSSATDTSTGGTVTLTAKSTGTVTVRATADDGSAAYGTKTIYVRATSTYLYYDANGGSGGPSTQTVSLTYATSSSKSVTVSSTVPTRDGYTFLGWATSSTASEYSYTGGDSISVTYGTNTTLYAVWEQDVYTVTFVSDGATYSTATATYGGTVSAPSTNPTLTGYYFTGWYTDMGATDAYDFTSAVSADLTLYAGWVEELEFTSVPAISEVVITRTASGSIVLTATASDYQQIAWYVDGALAGYGDTITLDLAEGTYEVSAVASNSLGSATWGDSVTVTTDGDGTGTETTEQTTDWTLVSIVAVAAILGLVALYTRSVPATALTAMAAVLAVLLWMGII